MLIPEVKKEKVSIKIGDVVFDEQYYARFEPNQALISEYESSIQEIIKVVPCFEVSEDNILIDGFHRWKAAERILGKDCEVPAIRHKTKNVDYILLESYAANTRHGKRNSRPENIKNIRALYARGFTLEQIQEKLNLSKAFIYEATTDDRKREKEERDKKIIEMYLRAENTQEKIADLLGVDHKTVSNIVDSGKKSIYGNFAKNFTPLLYNIWNTPKQDNERQHFGAFPEVFMENLLHFHTDPLDVVYDPFGGGGTTVDICKKMFRRYYVSDRKVIPGREHEIKQHDIKDGLPKDLPLPAFVFLDPPYWTQAENMYSKDKEDLGNMTLDDFNESMRNLLKTLEQRKVKKIAIVIQPTQYKNNWNWTDHIFDFDKMLTKYEMEMRYVLPYSSQQYNAQMVDKAKENKKCLCLNRDLIVWRLK